MAYIFSPSLNVSFGLTQEHTIKSMILVQKDSIDFAFKSDLQPYLGNMLYVPIDSSITFSPFPGAFSCLNLTFSNTG